MQWPCTDPTYIVLEYRIRGCAPCHTDDIPFPFELEALSPVQDTAKDVKKNAGPTADNLADQAKQGGKKAADQAKGTAGQAKKSAHKTLKGALL